MYQNHRSNRLLTTIIVLLVLVLLSLFALIGVVVLSDRMAPAPEEPLPQSSQEQAPEPEEPARPILPETSAESSEEEPPAVQVIEPLQPQPAAKPQASSSASSSTTQQKAESSKSDTTDYPNKTYEKSGTYDRKQKLGNVTVKTGNILIENKTITGKLTVAKDTYGTIELVECVVEGPLYVRGGETIILTDSRVSEIFMMEGYGQEVKLVADSESRCGKVTAYTSVILDESELASSKPGFSELKIASGDPTVHVSLINTLLTKVTVDEKACINIDGGSSVGRLRINEPTQIYGDGEIELLIIGCDGITSYIIPDEEEKTKNRFDDVVYQDYSVTLKKPTGLSVDYQDSDFRLSWTAADANATGYRVEMTAEGLSYTKEQTGTSIAVGDDFIGKATTFRVQAITTKSGYSSSDWATLTYTPKQVGNPTGLAVQSVEGNKATLVWNAAANAASYTLTYQKEGAGSATSVNDLTGTSATVELPDATAGATYTFTLTTVGAANTKPAAHPSATVTHVIGS